MKLLIQQPRPKRIDSASKFFNVKAVNITEGIVKAVNLTAVNFSVFNFTAVNLTTVNLSAVNLADFNLAAFNLTAYSIFQTAKTVQLFSLKPFRSGSDEKPIAARENIWLLREGKLAHAIKFFQAESLI